MGSFSECNGRNLCRKSARYRMEFLQSRGVSWLGKRVKKMIYYKDET